ncbi:MAG: hypothetical protein ACRD3C_08995 [Vicinamibacterales bacterium]
MSDHRQGFVSVNALRKGTPDPHRALADIRTLYFKTTRRTIEHDLAHAIELLKTLPTEEERDKARVYMDGLSQMRSEWAKRKPSGTSGKVEKWKSGKSRRPRSHGDAE